MTTVVSHLCRAKSWGPWGHYVAAASLLYCLGLLWVALLFPTVSVTTGEAKVRGLFVDENALTLAKMGTVSTSSSSNHDVKSRLLDTLWLSESMQSVNAINSDAFCNIFNDNVKNTLNGIHCSRNGPIVEVVIDSPYKPVALEVTVVAIPYIDGNEGTPVQFAAKLISSLTTVRWSAKRIVLLFAPFTDVNPQAAFSRRYSIDIKSWLDSYHGVAQYYGLIREAFVFDLQSSSINSTEVINSLNIKDATVEATSLADIEQWEAIDLLVNGQNGQLPNMDIISSITTLYNTPSRLLVLESTSSDGLLSLCPLPRSGYLWQLLCFTDDFVAVYIMPLMHTFGLTRQRAFTPPRNAVSLRFRTRYVSQLSSLLNFIHSSISMEHGHWHHHFLAKNIDAITIRPRHVSSTRPEPRNAQNAHTAVTLDNLVEMAVNLIRLSSGLQEELHHSLFFYLLIGSELFVGVTEYLPSLALLMAPIIGSYFVIAYRCPFDDAVNGFTRALAVVTPVLTASILASRDSSISSHALFVRGHAIIRTPASLIMVSGAVVVVFIAASLLLKSQPIYGNNNTERFYSLLGTLASNTLLLTLALAWIGIQHYAFGMVLTLAIAPMVGLLTSVVIARGMKDHGLFLAQISKSDNPQDDFDVSSVNKTANKIIHRIIGWISTLQVFALVIIISLAALWLGSSSGYNLAVRLASDWIEMGSYTFPVLAVSITLLGHSIFDVLLLEGIKRKWM